jgi:hypothetical protein
MSWLTRIGEPLCRTREEAEAYVTSELQRAVPEGWVVTKLSGPGLSWSIARQKVAPGEWPTQEYDLRLSNGLELFVFTYGNNDIGPLSLGHVMQKALVLDAAAVQEFGMRACLDHLIEHCKPNEWGYT